MHCTLTSLWMAFISGLMLFPTAVLAQEKLDDKLVKYVQHAKKAGENESQVQQKAVIAGWPEAVVRDAVAYVYGTSNVALASSPTPTSERNASQREAREGASAVGPDVKRPNDVAGDTSNRTTAVTSTANPSPNGTTGRASDRASGTSSPVPYEYRIGAGDVLQVSVWKEPEASAMNVVVRPDGMISTPLTKELHVAGLTPVQAEKLITEKLVKVIQEPDVTVVVTGMTSKKLYAVGAVKKEGPIPYTYSMTVMQAIAEAGGLTDYAKRSKIYVLRNDNGKETRFPFAYDDILRGKHMELNILMLPGDTLVVPH